MDTEWGARKHIHRKVTRKDIIKTELQETRYENADTMKLTRYRFTWTWVFVTDGAFICQLNKYHGFSRWIKLPAVNAVTILYTKQNYQSVKTYKWAISTHPCSPKWWGDANTGLFLRRQRSIRRSNRIWSSFHNVSYKRDVNWKSHIWKTRKTFIESPRGHFM